MSTVGRRVALLARPGIVCDRLRSAVAAIGADLVLEADPTALAPDVLDAARPQVVLVALDAQTEDALDRFDTALQDPMIEVIYEEAELVAKREGWEAARWIRHLSAKLNGHGDVLPPGAEPLDAAADEDASAGVADFSSPTTTGLSSPVDQMLTDPAPADGIGDTMAFDPFTAPVDDTDQAIAGNDGDHRHAFDPLLAEADFDAEAQSTVAEVSLSGFDLDGMDMSVAAFDPVGDQGADPVAGRYDPANIDYDTVGDGGGAFEFTLDAADSLPLEALRGDSSTAREPGFDQTFDGDFSALSASNAPAEEDPVDDEQASDVAPRRLLELVDEDAESSPVAASHREREADGRFRHDLAALDARIANLELVDDRVLNGPAQANGAVLVLAGIGGPDAVRQLLGALPEDFPRPVLVQQRLDGGRYDKLVAQMQRATAMLVKLAEPGMRAIDGVIYILPADVGVNATDNGLQFNDAAGDVLSALPAADSAVLLLSGSDLSVVDAAMKHSWAGALCLGQSPDGCYDAAAASDLVARGAEAGQPAELAQRLAARWRS